MERSSFFNAELKGEEYDRVYLAEDYARYFASFIGNGVFPTPSTNLQVVSDGTTMNLTLKQGKAWINGYFYENTEDLSLSIDVADGVLNRIDRVVLRLDFVNREIKAYVKKGEFSSSPVAPTLQRDADMYELGIADIKINKGITKLVQADITDLRQNNNYCGLVAGVVQQIDTTNLFTQFQSSFDIWFEHIKGQLSEDAAGNLQLQIDTWNDFKANGGEIGGTITFPKGIIRQTIQKINMRGKDYTQRSGVSNYNGYPTWAIVIEDPDDDNNTNGLLFMLGSGAGDAYNNNYIRPFKIGFAQKNILGSPNAPFDILYLREKLSVKRDDGYVEVEDSLGRKIAMHTNEGIGWIHLFDSSGRVINDVTINPDGTITSGGTSITKIPCCKVYHPSTQVFPGGNVKNTLAWDSVLFSSHAGMCGNVGTTANIVVPETGIYQFDATIVFSGATGQVRAVLSKNNSETIDTKYLNCNGGINNIQLSGMYPMTKGDYVQIHLYSTESGSITVYNSSRYQAHLVRGKI